MKKLKIIFIFISFVLTSWAQDTLYITCYNVENLFDNQHDSLYQDEEFTPHGQRHWTYDKWQLKMDHIAQVIANCVAPDYPILLGLCEVENKRCIQQLCYKMRSFNYSALHYNSPDQRGIDVALFYDSTSCQIINSKSIRVNLHNTTTRDILYAKIQINQKDTIHIFVCHFPSQYSGSSETQWKRDNARITLQNAIDSIIRLNPSPNIICMGDFNGEPKQNIKYMSNLMTKLKTDTIASHKYQGKWTWLDQFYISSSLISDSNKLIINHLPYVYAPSWLLERDINYLGCKPNRTYIGYTYHRGYSDHLPIILPLIQKE